MKRKDEIRNDLRYLWKDTVRNHSVPTLDAVQADYFVEGIFSWAEILAEEWLTCPRCAEKETKLEKELGMYVRENRRLKEMLADKLLQ